MWEWDMEGVSLTPIFVLNRSDKSVLFVCEGCTLGCDCLVVDDEGLEEDVPDIRKMTEVGCANLPRRH
jgi:hypothetical protein